MISDSALKTKRLAARLAKKIIKERPHKTARVLALQGELGAGKTTFTQGFAKALGIKHHLASPTFIIIRRYGIGNEELGIKNHGFKNLFHLDLYRIHKPKEILDLGFKKILKNPGNIVLIEWPEKVKKFLPKDTIWVRFSHSKKEKERIIRI